MSDCVRNASSEVRSLLRKFGNTGTFESWVTEKGLWFVMMFELISIAPNDGRGGLKTLWLSSWILAAQSQGVDLCDLTSAGSVEDIKSVLFLHVRNWLERRPQIAMCFAGQFQRARKVCCVVLSPYARL